MTRPPRLEYAGARYHVINRGNYRKNVFGDEGAAEAFERTLGEAAEKFGWRVGAYVVMRNHFHLAVETPEPNLSQGMKWLQGTWARRFNRYRAEIGRPFQGRFKSLAIEDGEGYRKVCDYIHLNPVRAQVVEPMQIAAYRWSSLKHYVGKKTPQWLDGEWLLRASGLTCGAAGWRAYCVRLGVLMDDKQCREQLSSKNLSRGWCIGSKKFKQTMQESVKEQLSRWRQRRFAGLEPDERRAEQSRYWEEALQAYAQAAKVNLNGLGKKKSEPEKVKLAAAMKSATSASNGWLAERLGMGEPASVSQFVRRWFADARRKREVDLLLSRVKV
jgi:Transposase and inactivated derivatives